MTKLHSSPARPAVPGKVDILPGVNGLAKAVLTHACGAHAEVQLYGGHVTSWKDASGAELLFMSEKSWFEPGRPIRGGIPVCWPQFGGKGPLPQHGFARTSSWQLARAEVSPSGESAVVLRLTDTPETLELWPFRFQVELTVSLGERLSLALKVTNCGPETLPFTCVFHTYFAVADIRRTLVRGLKGVSVIHAVGREVCGTEERGAIPIVAETDNLYLNAPGRVEIEDAANRRRFVIEKCGMDDVVVWNPWIAKARRMPDFGEVEYLRMLCVETAVVEEPIRLKRGECWDGWTRLSVGR